MVSVPGSRSVVMGKKEMVVDNAEVTVLLSPDNLVETLRQTNIEGVPVKVALLHHCLGADGSPVKKVQVLCLN